MTKEAPKGEAPPDGEAPPSYTTATEDVLDATDPSQNIDVTTAFANLSLSSGPSTGGPNVDTTLAHLKLLHAIDTLKEDVGYTDGLYGIFDSRAKWDTEILHGAALPPGVQLDKLGGSDKEKLALSRLREKRWAIFLARAVDRYEAWWNAMARNKTMLTEEDMSTPDSPKYLAFSTSGKPLGWTRDSIPPLGKLFFTARKLTLPLCLLDNLS